METKKKSKSKKGYIDSLIEDIKSKSLYFIRYQNGLKMFAIGANIKEALDGVGLGTAVRNSYKIENFEHLVRVDNLVDTYINVYRTNTIITSTFTCLFDDYVEEKYWLCINSQTGQRIRLNPSPL